MNLKCCDLLINNSFIFKIHFYHTHYNSSNNKNNFKCPVINCEETISYYSNLKLHFERVHFEIYEQIFLNKNLKRKNRDLSSSSSTKKFKSSKIKENDNLPNQNTIDNINLTELNDNIDYGAFQNSFTLNNNSASKFKDDLINMLIDSKFDNVISEKAACEIVNHFTKLLINNKELIDINRLLELSKKLTDSTYYLNSKLKQNLEKSKIVKVNVKNNNKTNSFYRVNLRSFIENFIKVKDVKNELIKERTRRPSNIELKSFRDGSYYVLKINEIILNLILYFDDFDILNFNSTGDQKLSSVYGSFTNFPYSLMCRRDDIFVLALAKRKIIDEIGLDNFFNQLNNEIKEIQENPIQLNDNFKCSVNLVGVCADNLGANQLLNLTTCFKSASCKYCKITYKTLQIDGHYKRKFKKRNHQTSIFKNINKKIHFISDLFHDINEGEY